MGRPIKQLYLGNRNPDGVGGESIASVTVGGTNNSTGYTTGDAVTFEAPTLVGGTTAAGTVVAHGDGNIISITMTVNGSGYESAPNVTAATGTIGTTTLTAVLSTGTQNAIQASAYIPGGGSALAADIISQRSTNKYNVENSEGTGVCTLVTAAPAEGEMTITATDSAAGTYYVKKLTNNTVIVIQNSGTQFADGAKVKWTMGSAVEDESVTLANA